MFRQERRAASLLLSRSRRPPGRGAFTLVEVLVATALTLLIMAATVTLFGSVTEGIAGSRAIIETMDRLRGTKERLATDLRGVTAPMLPPLKPEWNLGYFEYVEGVGTRLSPYPVPQDAYGNTDTTIGDTDDVLMFTTRSETEPFIGAFQEVRQLSPLQTAASTRTSPVAEVAWFVRGTTLYRRVLLVRPNSADPAGDGFHWFNYAQSLRPFYFEYDISARQIGGTQAVDDGLPATGVLVPNTLGDLTKRENRFAHMPRKNPAGAGSLYGFPHGISFWGVLGLPTLQECSHPNWLFPLYLNNPNNPVPVTGIPLPGPVSPRDYWNNPYQGMGLDYTGTLPAYASMSRIAEDVILTNVISFDVRAWDPGAPIVAGASGTILVPGDAGYDPSSTHIGYGAYVDLGWNTMGYTPAAGQPPTLFGGVGNYPVGGTAELPRVYDTWSTHYEYDGVDQDGDGDVDEGSNRVDDDGAYGIDDPGEWEAPPPYPYPLRGIQVKIRVFEPDSRQIREVTVVQDFLPE